MSATETDLNPKKALSDSNSMLDIKKLKSLLKDLLKINQAV